MKIGREGRLHSAALMLVLLTACDGSSGGRYADHDDNYNHDWADSDARDKAAEEARQAIYSEHGADDDGHGADPIGVGPYDVEDSREYVCTQDCSGHEAGFAWAQDNDITDETECGGNSISFIEGCEAFAQERQEHADRLAQEAGEEAVQDAFHNYDEDRGDDEHANYDGRLIDGRY